ncbi:MAG: hypothetical protein Q9192_009033, partial [Flavoplaca navasiana]
HDETLRRSVCQGWKKIEELFEQDKKLEAEKHQIIHDGQMLTHNGQNLGHNPRQWEDKEQHDDD